MLNFGGDISALQYCTGNFSAFDRYRSKVGRFEIAERQRIATEIASKRIASEIAMSQITAISRGNLKGWFPKGWFWRMFPRNENRNEGTFAKTTLLETALLSPNDPFWC